jgi:hypothetical protein
MPLTAKGEKILSNLVKEYGSEEKGKQVLYAGKNAGTFTGIDSVPAGLQGICDQLAAMCDEVRKIAARADACFSRRADELRGKGGAIQK